MRLERNRIYEKVRDEILSCTLMPGAEVREHDLAAQYNVSKSPVRDAMQKLEFEGLIEIRARQGCRVRPISMRDADDLLELRGILEAGAILRLAKKASDDDLVKLNIHRTADTHSIENFTEYNRNFHKALGSLCGNARLGKELDRVLDLYDRLCVISLGNLDRAGGFDAPLSDHNNIIDALQERSGTTAKRLMQRHLAKSRNQIMKGLANTPIVA